MRIKQVLAVIGSLILLAGVFTPIVSIPIMGEMTYYQNGRTEAVIVLVFAALSLILGATKIYKGLWLTGIGSLAVLLYTLIRFQTKISEMKSDMDTTVADTPLHGLVDMAMQTIQFQWGWGILLVGTGLIIAAAALKEN